MVESKGFKSAWNRIQIELCFSCVSLGDPQNSVYQNLTEIWQDLLR